MKTVLLMTHFESSVFRAIAESISICSKKQGWALHIITAADAEDAKSIAESWHADGCIVYASSPSGLNLKDADLQIPTICISPAWESNGKLTIKGDVNFSGSIVVKAGSTLVIDSTANIANSGSITVEAGATLATLN